MGDVNKLRDILNRSKAVMDKTDKEYGIVSNSITDNVTQSYGEKEMPNLTENYINQHSSNPTQSVAPTNGRYKNIKTSKMPKEILKAMINNPIDIPESPYPTFELEDVGDLVNTTPTPNIKESITPQSSNINKNTIRKIVKEEIEGIVRNVVEEYLDKALITEDIQIKIGDTVFSGNLKPLPKKRKTKRRV